MNIPRSSSTAFGALAVTILAVFAAGCGSGPGTAPSPSAGAGNTVSAESTSGEGGGPAEEASGAAATAGNDDGSAEKTSDAAGSDADAEKTGESGGELPEVTQVDNEQLASVLDETKGKVTVLNIWATWCPPCIHEMPDLVTFYNETDRESVAFISLSIDDVVELDGAIPEFQREHEMPFPIYVLNERDIEGIEKALRGSFGGALPTTYIYDRDGEIAMSVTGIVTLPQLHKEVEPLL